MRNTQMRDAARLILGTHKTADEIATEAGATKAEVIALSDDMRTLDAFQDRYGFEWLDLINEQADETTRPQPSCGAVNAITHSVCELDPHPAGTEHDGPDPINGRCRWTVPSEAKSTTAPQPPAVDRG